MEKYIKMIVKYICFGLMFVFLGIIGVGVFFFYIVRKIFEGEEVLEVETDDWGEIEN
jgi:hypothetical protein